MCHPSVISDDWVTKGFHLHVEGIELAVRPGNRSDPFPALFRVNIPARC
jgi:hypothetical protein